MVRARWWPDWTFGRAYDNFSILDVVKFGTIDFKLAGLLWLLMECRASVIVAAGPIWAGKTTLFHALLDFLPPEITQVSLRGFDEDFSFLGDDKPENTYLVTEEMSNHGYDYLWGYQVVKAFELLSQGYALGGTIHARSTKEVAYVLNALRVPLPLIGNLGIVVTMQVAPGRTNYDEPVRYVDTVSTLLNTKEGLVAQILAVRQFPDEKFMYQPEPVLHDVFVNKFSVKYGSISPEIELRGDFLKQMHKKGISSREDVKQGIADFYLSKTS